MLQATGVRIEPTLHAVTGEESSIGGSVSMEASTEGNLVS